MDSLAKRKLGAFVGLTAICLSNLVAAKPVTIPTFSVQLCGIASPSGKTNQLALRQYLSHFSRIDLDETSLKPKLGVDGIPCIRPVVRNTAVSLIHRAVELGYATWDPSSGMLDLDTWMISMVHAEQIVQPHITLRSTSKSKHHRSQPSRFKFPWLQIMAALLVMTVALILLQFGRLSSLMIRRTSIAGLGIAEGRSKVRGIAIPTVEALQITHTDIQAVAYLRTTKKYGHNGWQITGRDSQQISCSIDDGTGCIDVDLTHANVHFSNQVAIYNGIPGEHMGRSPYMDDTNIVFDYIPVGAVLTLIGTLVPHDTCFRAMKNVHVYDGDERVEVRLLKFRVLLCMGVLLVLSVLMFILRPGL